VRWRKQRGRAGRYSGATHLQEKPMAKKKSAADKTATAPVANLTPRLTPAVNIGISEADRAAIAGGLSKLLADTYTLYLTTHNFHWNVTGPMFNTLHTMFMAQYTELWNAVDPVAERIRSLGHAAPGSYAAYSRLSSLPDAPATPPAALEMVRILKEGHEAVARTARSIFPLADAASDEPTADLLTQRLTVHEQTAWMLRSLLED
jgi:starvation-inducible DNA-binding protein